MDVRGGDFNEELQVLRSEIPVLWKYINDICHYENSIFLPPDVSKIILTLLNIRKETFQKMPTRYQEDYIPYEEHGVFKEHNLAFYPMFPLHSWPKKYKISNNSEVEDGCTKNFPVHSDFSGGIFSIGCGCPNNVTYGFELICGSEGSRILFKLMMTRKNIRRRLQGIVYDNACNLQKFCLNRDPRD